MHDRFVMLPWSAWGLSCVKRRYWKTPSMPGRLCQALIGKTGKFPPDLPWDNYHNMSLHDVSEENGRRECSKSSGIDFLPCKLKYHSVPSLCLCNIWSHIVPQPRAYTNAVKAAEQHAGDEEACHHHHHYGIVGGHPPTVTPWTVR